MRIQGVISDSARVCIYQLYVLVYCGNTHHREHRGHVPEQRARERVARRSCEAHWRFTRSDWTGDATATQREAQDAYGQIFNKNNNNNNITFHKT